MKITYDKENNLAYIYLNSIAENEVFETKEISNDVNIDYGLKGNVLGIELLNAKEQLSLFGSKIEFEDIVTHKSEILELNIT